MHRRHRIHVVPGGRPLLTALFAVAAVVGSVSGGSIASATGATTLSVNQSVGFEVLGHDCGGIKEQSIGSGFDATTGFPTGYVFLKTVCSAGGKGGPTSTYKAWVTATWDFTGVLVSYAVTAAPSVDTTATATDAAGNEVYTTSTPVSATCATVNVVSCTYAAYLLLAPGFVPRPRLTGLSATVGPSTGGTSVTLYGTGFTAATTVTFGTTSASSFQVLSDQQLAVVTPPTVAGSVNVNVSSPGGTSTETETFSFFDRPIVSRISPRAALTSGDVTVNVTGAHFEGTTGVAVGGVAAGFTVQSDTSLSVFVPPTDGEAIVDLTVTSPGGQSAASAASRFIYAPTSCATAGACEYSVTCSKLSGRVHGTVRLTSCSPRSKRYASAKVKPDGIVTWSTSSKVTVTFLPPATAVGRGTCARGRTEWDLAGAVTGGTATNTAFGDSVFARMCATPTGSVTLVPHSRFLL